MAGEARELTRQRKWREARDQLAPLAESGEAQGADLDALGDAAYALADYELALRATQDAHAAYRDAGDKAGAASTAIKLANVFIRRGELAVSRGWTSTAEQLLAGEPESAAHGLVSWMKAIFALVVDRDLEAAAALADE